MENIKTLYTHRAINSMKKITKSHYFAFRTNLAESLFIELSAQKNGMTKSEFIRAKLLEDGK